MGDPAEAAAARCSRAARSTATRASCHKVVEPRFSWIRTRSDRRYVAEVGLAHALLGVTTAAAPPTPPSQAATQPVPPPPPLEEGDATAAGCAAPMRCGVQGCAGDLADAGGDGGAGAEARPATLAARACSGTRWCAARPSAGPVPSLTAMRVFPSAGGSSLSSSKQSSEASASRIRELMRLSPCAESSPCCPIPSACLAGSKARSVVGCSAVARSAVKSMVAAGLAAAAGMVDAGLVAARVPLSLPGVLADVRD